VVWERSIRGTGLRFRLLLLSLTCNKSGVPTATTQHSYQAIWSLIDPLDF
jgi:hypothetical protein